MAENVTLPGTGDVAAADDIAGVKHQRVKVSLGPDGTAVDLNGDSAGGAWIQGPAARGSGIAGKPNMIAGRASGTPPGAVSQDAVVDQWLTLNGATVADGGVAHDAVDTGNPLKIGGKAVDVLDSFPTDVGPGDRVDALFGLKGQLFVSLMGQDGSADPTTLPVQGIGGGVPLPVGLNQLNISQTPTVTSGAYAANDAMGGLLTFANAARVSAGSGIVQAVTILCKTPALLPALELVLFNQTFTAMTDNGTWSPSDADMLNCIGSIPIAAWSDATTNSIATRFGLAFPFILTGTSLFGQLVTRAAVTLTSTSDIVIGIQVIRD